MAEAGEARTNAWRFRQQPGRVALAALASLAGRDWPALAAADPRLIVHADGRCSIHVTFRPGASRSAVAAATGFRDEFAAELVRRRERPLGQSWQTPGAFDLAGASGALVAAVALTAFAVEAAPQAEREGDEGERLVLAPDADLDRLAAILPELVRSGRDVRLHVGALDGGAPAAAARLDDSAVRGGVLRSRLAHGDLAGVHLMRPHGAGAFTLWLPVEAAAPPAERLGDLGTFLAAGRGGGALAEDAADLAWLPREGGGRLFLLPPAAESVPGSDFAEDAEPAQPLALSVHALRGDPATVEALRARIAALDPRMGWRIRLEPLRDGRAALTDVEPLLVQIDDLREEIDRIRALRAPQLRLLRFSDRQLPAMVSALRSVPSRALVEARAIRYAASHAGARAGPAHFLLYDPEDVIPDFAELVWRDRTEDRPMSYWLDPHVALAAHERPARTRVFVPHGSILAPSIASFGEDVDGTLRLVLGDLFPEVSPVFADPDARPFFVFTDLGRPGLELEVVDGRAFAPLLLQLPWINDYLQLAGPPPAPMRREDLEAVALELYRGEVASDFRGDLEARRAEIEATWREALTEVGRDAAGLVADLAAELERATDRIALIDGHLGRLGKRMREAEAALRRTEALLSGHDDPAGEMEIRDARLRTARRLFQDRVSAELTVSEAAIEAAEGRVAELRRRLDELLRGRRR